jgi:dolichyl-diphosphooligosaccharide--protein glycosyltransferase
MISVLAPAAVILSAVAISAFLNAFCEQLNPDAAATSAAADTQKTLRDDQTSSSRNRSRKKPAGGRGSASARTPELPAQREFAMLMILGMVLLLCSYVRHSIWTAVETHSSPSIVLPAAAAGGKRMVFDDYRESYQWLRQNTASDSVVMAWWDYGSQISALGNRTTLVAADAWNASHVGTVALAFASPEEKAYEIMRTQLGGVDYVLVTFGGVVGYTSDDIAKLPWMLRIASATYPDAVQEGDYLNPDPPAGKKKKKPGQSGGAGTGKERLHVNVDHDVAPTALLQSLLYKLCYSRFSSFQTQYGKAAGYDRARSAEIGPKAIQLEYFQEVYTSTNWLVRIYRVSTPDDRNRR